MKRILSVLLMTALMAALLCATASAEGEQRSLKAGFYEIGTADNVTIEPRTADDIKVDPTTAAVGQGTSEYYESAERLSVTYTGPAEENDQFLVLLVTGNGLPTASDTICYIDQTVTATGGVTFDVYPMLPETGTDLTLYITSSREDFTTIQVDMKYAVDDTYTEYTEVLYTVGDVDEDSYINVADAARVIDHFLERAPLTGSALLAANVNGDDYVNVNDAAKIIDYFLERITGFQ